MSVHDAIAALPATGGASHALIRALVTKRMAYCFDDSEDVTAFTAADPEDGTLPLYLIQAGTLFGYDETDTTTAHDGVTCLVTDDGKRYKTDDVQFPYSVLNSTTTAQPTDPSDGDAYRVPTAATGDDWSGKDGKIAVYTARGWVFKSADTGQLLYDQDKDSFYHLDSDGSWVLGFGEQSLPDGAVLPSNMSGGGAKIRWMVENQTTNDPPTSPTDLVEYIVGTSPTGDWAGKAGQIARYENGEWVFYNPSEGWTAYDKNLNTDYQFNGTAWVSAAGAWVNYKPSDFDPTAQNMSPGGTGSYAYSATSAPSTERHVTLPFSIFYTARRTGAKLRFTLRVTLSGDSDSSGYKGTLALMRDDESAAVSWSFMALTPGRDEYFERTFVIDAIDTDEHFYLVSQYIETGGVTAIKAQAMSLDIEEAA